MPSGAVLEGRGLPLQPKSAGLPGITRQRVGLPLKMVRLNSLLLLLLLLLFLLLLLRGGAEGLRKGLWTSEQDVNSVPVTV